MSENSSTFRFAWSIFMVVVYLGIAYLVVFTPVLIRYNNIDNSSSNDQNFIIRIVLGIILFVYGVFRGYRIWKTNRA